MAPTANPYASTFFAAGAPPPPMPADLGGYPGPLTSERLSAPAGSGMGMAERRSLSLPPLPPVRTSSAKSPGELVCEGGARLRVIGKPWAGLWAGERLHCCPALRRSLRCAQPAGAPPLPAHPPVPAPARRARRARRRAAAAGRHRPAPHAVSAPPPTGSRPEHAPNPPPYPVRTSPA